MRRKRGCDRKLYETFYGSCPADRQPQMRWLEGGVLEMEDLLCHPIAPGSVLEAAREMWDAGPDFLKPDHLEYARYCERVAVLVGQASTANYIWRAVQQYCRDVTPVRNCHADMTIANCMFTRSKRLVFIDPGYHRDLPCKELDESKLLQSIDGWEHVRHNRDVAFTDKSWVTDTHKCLLATHYLRILRHDHPSYALAFARHRYLELLNEL